MTFSLDMAAVLADVERHERAARRRHIRSARRQAAACRDDVLHFAWRVRKVAELYRERAARLLRLVASVDAILDATPSWHRADINGPHAGAHARVRHIGTELTRHATLHGQVVDTLLAIGYRLEALRTEMRRRDARRFRRDAR